MNLTWIWSPNNLPPLLPLCFLANTNSLQSEPRCVWLYQRQMETFPTGTELTCGKTEMHLVLPISTLKNLIVSELQLNHPSCSVTSNSTHVMASISLTGCGTKRVHSGSEMVYTNTLRSVRNTVISRQPTLIMPIACRFPGVETKGPRYAINMPSEQETFGIVKFWLEFYRPGEGPMANRTKIPKFRHLLPSSQRVR
ncbi:oncoprotein-induced transcript 3 protein-like [Salmo trutta]|uniref:oncoprotein-induced transcript 3 protein-like n=1 Tax=Salmo trutta TaxID=8032 RepID=UPI0011305B04|nr:oncoprotein-induced transcript 3 protein-like [Salmo trutta]